METAKYVAACTGFGGLLLVLYGSSFFVRGEVDRSDRRGWQDLFGWKHFRIGLVLTAIGFGSFSILTIIDRLLA